MITETCKFHGRHGLKYESCEEKYERRQEKRENLRKKNRTMCRLVHKHQGGKAKEKLQSAREQEFFRRRHLVIETPKMKDIQCHLRREESWNNCNLQLRTKSEQHDFSDICVTEDLIGSSKNMFIMEASQSCKGTQTSDVSSEVKKNSGQQTDCETAVLDKEIIEISNYLKEALHRELLLKQKMMILQELLATLLHAAEKSWKGQINEDKLKCRLAVLENQVQTCMQTYPKRSLKKILLEMEDQKQNYEQKMKEALQNLLEEKLQAERQLQNTQRALDVSKKDSTLLKEQYCILNKDWSQLIDSHVELENKLHVLENKLQWSDTQNLQLHQALQNMERERVTLYSSIDSLQENNRLTMECLTAMEEKLRTEERQKLALEAAINQLHSQSSPEKSELLTTDSAILNVQSENKKGREERPEDEKVGIFQFTAKEKEKQCQPWIPLLLVVMVTALVSYLINLIP